jgi:hypothetical protein
VKLIDVVDRLDRLDDQDTIYVQEAAPAAAAVVTREPDDGTSPHEAVGLTYFLEVKLAKDAVRVWREWRGGAIPTLDDKLAAVIHYAANDSFLPVD